MTRQLPSVAVILVLATTVSADDEPDLRLMARAVAENEPISQRWDAMNAILDRAPDQPDLCVFLARHLDDPTFEVLLSERFTEQCRSVRRLVFEILYSDGEVRPVHYRALLTSEEFQHRDELLSHIIQAGRIEQVARLAYWAKRYTPDVYVEDFAARIVRSDWEPAERVTEGKITTIGYDFGTILLRGRTKANAGTVDAALEHVARRLEDDIRKSEQTGAHADPYHPGVLSEINRLLDRHPAR